MMQSSSISSASGGAMKLSPLFAAIVSLILYNPLACQAWTNIPLLSSTPSRLQQQQQTLPHEGNTIDGSNVNQKLMWWRQTILNAGRKRRDDATQLFASSSSSDDDNISGSNEHEDEAAIMEIADALFSTTPSPQPPANNQVNGFVQKAQQAWTDAPNGMTLNGDSISTNTDIDANIYNEEEAKYLTLAKEAWTEFFSDQVSQEEFLNMALDAWRDASLVTLQQDVDDGGSLQSVEEEVQSDTTTLFVEEQEVESQENVEINGAQSDTAPVEAQESISVEEEEDNVETTTNEQKWGMPAFLSGLFSGSKKSSDAPAEASFAEENDEEDVPYGLRMKDTSFAEENDEEELPYGLRMKDTSFAEENDEEELPYGLRMKSSSASVLPPPPSSSAPAMDDTTTTEKGGDDALNNNINSMKAKSLGEKQMTPPISKGVAPTLKSLDKKQIMPPPSPINKGFTTPPMNKGVVKGKETSFSGGNKLSSTPPSFLNKGGTKKLGIQGKFAPKKLDIATKKKPQGKRGGLSFLKSDKLSKEYKADKNFNPMNKGVTVEKMKGLKIGQVGKAKSDDDTEGSSEDGEEEPEETKSDDDTEASPEAHNKAEKSKAPSNASDLPPATKLITAGMTAEEAEIIRKSRLLTEEETTALVEKASLEVTPVIVTETTEASPKVTPTAIISGMTAEEAERARMARLEISDKMKEKIKISAEKKGGVGNMPLKTIPLKGPMPKIPNTINDVSKGMPLKGGISAGAKQPKQSGKGLPFLKKSPSFGLDSTTKKTLSPLPLKAPKGDSDIKKKLTRPPLAKTSLGDVVAKKGFPPLPTPQKGAVPIPMKGPITKAAPSFSMEKKTLPPLPLKGKGDDAGMKKGMGLPPLAKKSFGDGAAGGGVKKGFPSAPMPMKGPMSKASDKASDDPIAPKGLPLKGGMGMSMGEKQAGLPGKGMPFMKKAPSFSMEKKTLPPLPLKGKGDDAGMKKGMGLPPLAKKSFGDGAAAGGMKKGFPSAPMPMKGPILKGSDEASDDPIAPKGLLTSDVSKDLPLKGGISDTITESEVKAAKTKSNAVVLSPATPLISDGMTAEEAERIRLSRLQVGGEISPKTVDTASKPVDEIVQPEDTLTAITEGMTAEEAERARIARDTTTIDLAALQSRIQQLEDPKPIATPRRTINSKSVEAADFALLKKTTALLETKIDSALSHIDKLESKIEELDEENLQLRRDNTELREELDDLKRTVALIDCLSEVGQ